MKEIFDEVSIKCSKLTTKSYSTSFSLAIQLLDKKFHEPIYAIYGYVRLADEIVDSFHNFDKKQLLDKFAEDTSLAIRDQISLNPILNSFQATVHNYQIEQELIDLFLNSMYMDLKKRNYNQAGYEEYLLGSSEVVGLMCLRVFTERDKSMYEKLKPSAMALGAAFQKVNFLRDVAEDFKGLGRTYFPGVNMNAFSSEEKATIEQDIENDFSEALTGIKQLPPGAKRGVYLAFVYYNELLKKIKRVSPEQLTQKRIRIYNMQKLYLMFNSWVTA